MLSIVSNLFSCYVIPGFDHLVEDKIKPKVSCSLGWAMLYPNVSKSLITGGKSHSKPYSNTRSQPRWSKTAGGAGGDGEAEGGDRQKGGCHGSPGTLVRAGVPGGANSRVHEAHVLGAVVGCHGAHLLLRYLHVLHDRLRLLPQDLQRAFLWRVLSEPVWRKAEATLEGSQFWHCKVQRAPESL